MHLSSSGFELLYSTEKVSEDTIRTFQELADESKAIDKMRAMQFGEVINQIVGFPSENRAVLHTALRDFFDDPMQSPAAKEAALLARREVEKLKKFIEKIDREDRFTDLVVIAIGGSHLGPEALYLSLKHLQKKGRRVFFISNIDPYDATMVLRQVDLAKTLVAVSSKSGTTLETLTNEEIVRSHFHAAGLKSEDHFISITAEGSPLDDSSRYFESFYIQDYIGGRYSASSLFGGLILAFACGYNVYWELLQGAHAMDRTALNRDIHQNLPLFSALLSIWNRNFLNYPTSALIPYSQALSRWAAHIQQVEMESNGKRIDRKGQILDHESGPIIWGEPGTNAQHSFYQLIHQGTSVVPVEMIGFKEPVCPGDQEIQGTTSQEKLLSNLFAQSLALAVGQKSDNPNKVFPGNRPSRILLIEQLTPYSMGSLLAYYEHKVAFQGFIWNINSFDQEGVQLGKLLANRFLDLFASDGAVKEKSNQFPLGEALLRRLNF